MCQVAREPSNQGSWSCLTISRNFYCWFPLLFICLTRHKGNPQSHYRKLLYTVELSLWQQSDVWIMGEIMLCMERRMLVSADLITYCCFIGFTSCCSIPFCSPSWFCSTHCIAFLFQGSAQVFLLGSVCWCQMVLLLFWLLFIPGGYFYWIWKSRLMIL